MGLDAQEPWYYAIFLLVSSCFFVFFFDNIEITYTISAIFGYAIGSVFLSCSYSYENKRIMPVELTKNIAAKYFYIFLIALSMLSIQIMTLFLRIQVASGEEFLTLFNDAILTFIDMSMTPLSAYYLIPFIFKKTGILCLKWMYKNK